MLSFAPSNLAFLLYRKVQQVAQEVQQSVGVIINLKEVLLSLVT